MEPVKEEIRRLLRAAVVRAEPKTHAGDAYSDF
jgi:hypothetical protein